MSLSWLLVFCGLAIITGVKQRIPATKGHDPGMCNKKNHGKVSLVKNKADDEILLVCVKNKNGYIWKSTEGTYHVMVEEFDCLPGNAPKWWTLLFNRITGSKNTYGEFFNPGYDCTDILDKLGDAEDGFYWITLKSQNTYKVWCDMTTDGGGFILIGRKNHSITWTVPSNNKPVDPFGEPHWTSSLGDASILDFRVQMATRDDFKATKAHWSFRLQSKRPLKNLITTTGGCDQRSAGIGNIAYVKDLLTEKIVTTKMRCSKFGFAHHRFLKFGWTMMNSCLQKPCPWGFAFYKLIKVQTDNYGGFSFSTNAKISGMEYNATAFIGCDNGHCCGCYGPVGGSKDYCAQNCKAINGGKIRKNVFTWFWIRTSLPKRLWKKCMDYQVKKDDGKIISYRLIGHSVVPVKGQCNKASVLLHDGIVVAPDSSTAKKIPDIDGLLEYRKDKQELYVRSNKTWNAIAKEEKVNKKIDRLENLIKKINTSFSRVLSTSKECLLYKWLRDSTRNKEHVSTKYLCDNGLSTGWYRFGGGAGTRIPTTCVSQHRCQGDYTGWMKGSHPTVADGKVKRAVCFSHDRGNCCHWSQHIEVINCGSYYVYKLVPVSKCRARYCGANN